jgi:DNA repair protein RadC
MRKITNIPDIDEPREKLMKRDILTLAKVELLAVLIGRGVLGVAVLQVASEVEK